MAQWMFLFKMLLGDIENNKMICLRKILWGWDPPLPDQISSKAKQKKNIQTGGRNSYHFSPSEGQRRH